MAIQRAGSEPLSRPAESGAIGPVRLRWRGRRDDGTIVEGRDSASSKAELRLRLARRGIWPISVSSERRRRSIDPETLATALTQLAKLSQARLPLLQAIATVQQSHQNNARGSRFREALDEVAFDIENGSTLADALARAAVIDDFTARMIAVGESTGRLADVLSSIAEEQTTRRRHVKALRKSLAYPSSVLAIAVIITVILMINVVPKFADIYRQFGSELPAATALVLDVSHYLRTTGIYAFPLALVIMVTGAYSLQRLGSDRIHDAMQTLLANAPFVRKIQQARHLSATMRTLAIGIESGVPVIQALELARSVSRGTLQRDLSTVIRRVNDGAPLAQSMQSADSFPPIVTSMVAAGEASGDLTPMLRHSVDHFDEILESRIAILTAMAEPLVMVLLGGLVGGILIALYLPIFGLGGVLGGT